MAAALRVATRGSALARWQAQRVVDLLGVDAELVVVSTRGDERADVPIHTMGGTGVFVKEVGQRVLAGDADIAVHSAKDLPSATEPGLVLAAVPERGDARDAIVGSTLADVPTGGRVGTGSVRRRAQLASVRPDLTFGELRGNIPTRLEKAASFDAVVLAAAALDRLGLGDRIAERLSPSVMLPQVAQGALAVECRAGEFATVSAAGAVELEVLLASLDGRIALRARATGSEPEVVGAAAADQLLDARGGSLLLEDFVGAGPGA
jgi:hydroxymethylbilane synthase